MPECEQRREGCHGETKYYRVCTACWQHLDSTEKELYRVQANKEQTCQSHGCWNLTKKNRAFCKQCEEDPQSWSRSPRSNNSAATNTVQQTVQPTTPPALQQTLQPTLAYVGGIPSTIVSPSAATHGPCPATHARPFSPLPPPYHHIWNPNGHHCAGHATLVVCQSSTTASTATTSTTSTTDYAAQHPPHHIHHTIHIRTCYEQHHRLGQHWASTSMHTRLPKAEGTGGLIQQLTGWPSCLGHFSVTFAHLSFEKM